MYSYSNGIRLEKELLDKIKKDPAQFAVLYDKYYSVIFNYVFRRTADFELSRDITSEVFLKAYLKIGRFDWRGIPISAWLYRIASNETNYSFRKTKYEGRRISDTFGDWIHEIPDPASLESEKAEAEKIMTENQQFREVQKAMTQLPVHYQEVLALRYFENKKILEIAVILNKKEGTIKSLLSRGISKLQEMMQPNSKH